MGWGSYLLLGDLGQQLDIMQQRDEMERLRAAVAEAKSAPAPSGDSERIAQLEFELDEMRLYVVSLMRLLLSKELVSREDLERMLKMVDGLDGKEDGRHSGDEPPKPKTRP